VLASLQHANPNPDEAPGTNGVHLGRHQQEGYLALPCRGHRVNAQPERAQSNTPPPRQSLRPSSWGRSHDHHSHLSAADPRGYTVCPLTCRRGACRQFIHSLGRESGLTIPRRHAGQPKLDSRHAKGLYNAAGSVCGPLIFLMSRALNTANGADRQPSCCLPAAHAFPGQTSAMNPTSGISGCLNSTTPTAFALSNFPKTGFVRSGASS